MKGIEIIGRGSISLTSHQFNIDNVWVIFHFRYTEKKELKQLGQISWFLEGFGTQILTLCKSQERCYEGIVQVQFVPMPNNSSLNMIAELLCEFHFHG